MSQPRAVAGELLGQRGLQGAAAAHDHDAVGDRQRDRDVVADEHHGGSGVGERADVVDHLSGAARVQPGRRLVGEDQVGLTERRHREQHPAGHAAGELVREEPVDARGEATALERHSGGGLRIGEPRQARGAGHLRAHPRQRAQVRRRLRQQRHPLPGERSALRSVHFAVVETHSARLVGVRGQQTHHGEANQALAGATRADDRDDLARAHVERHVDDRGDGAASQAPAVLAEGDLQVLDTEDRGLGAGKAHRW